VALALGNLRKVLAAHESGSGGRADMSVGERCQERHPITRSPCRLSGEHWPHETRDGMKFLPKEMSKAMKHAKSYGSRAIRRGEGQGSRGQYQSVRGDRKQHMRKRKG
jgi:hypothetical protein